MRTRIVVGPKWKRPDLPVLGKEPGTCTRAQPCAPVARLPFGPGAGPPHLLRGRARRPEVL